MGFIYISFLAIIQGITEFLPISSSGHLLLIAQLFDRPEHNLQIDVAVHFGTLLAVVLFYRKDLYFLISGFYENIKQNFNHKDAIFFRLLVIATLPVVLAGLILKSTGLIHELRSLRVVGCGMVIFGVILYIADKYGSKNRLKSDWTQKDAFIMGFWQAFALIPGTSRSGNTISGGLFQGFSRVSCVNLSMIMSIPTILASTLLLSFDLIKVDFKNSNATVLLSASLISFLAAILALTLLVRFVKNFNFTPFVIYRVILGTLIIYLSY